MVEAVVFDLDGVLIDSEPVWEEVRRAFVAKHGGRWLPDSQQRLMGMSTEEWSTYLADSVGVPLPAGEIARAILERMAQRYEADLPLMPGAVPAVRRIAERWPLGLASSSSRMLIDHVLAAAGLTAHFTVVISSEEVSRGKPAPDVYLAAAHRLGTPPRSCAAVEDSSNGLRAASAAGLALIAVPNPRYPPDPEALALADVALGSLDELTVGAVESVGRPGQ